MTPPMPDWYPEWAAHHRKLFMLSDAWADSAGLWWETFAEHGATAGELYDASREVQEGPPDYQGKHLHAVLVALGTVRNKAAAARRRESVGGEDGPSRCVDCGGSGWAGPVPDPAHVRGGKWEPTHYANGRAVRVARPVVCNCYRGRKTADEQAAAKRRPMTLTHYQALNPGWRDQVAAAERERASVDAADRLAAGRFPGLDRLVARAAAGTKL